GECLGISLKNISAKPICVKIPAGWTFVSDDSTVQDLIIVKEELITLKGGETKTEKLFTMCTQSYNHGPSRDEKFSLGKFAEENLLKVAQFISSSKKLSTTAQCAVWAVANGNPIEEVYGEDTTEVRGLANLLSDILHIPVSSFIYTPRPHYLTNINTSFEWRTDEPLQKASLRLYDSTGTVIRTYFQDKDFEEGFHQKKFGLFHTQHPSSRFTLRLEADGKVIAQRIVNKEDSTTGLKRYDSNVLMRFKSLAAQNCRVAVYDEEGDLYFPVFKDKKYEAANYNTTVAVGVDLPKDKNYYVRIVNEGGKLVAEQKLGDKAQTEVFPPEKINVVWEYELTETIRGGKICAINEAGEEVKVYAENATLHPGKKNYTCTFTHTSGPKAHFKLVIKDAAGDIVKERVIK
ncbi:MAG: hypothetical protein ACKVTZ_04140, partial [Bacteroidia bacterium]